MSEELMRRITGWCGRTALASSVVVLLACSEQRPPLGPDVPRPEFNASAGATAPAALGWQEQARTLVAANNLSPLAAGRAFALLGVAQYAAIDNAGGQNSVDGTLPADGFGAGGRALFEAERGAVAGASSLVLAYLFPGAAAALEQRVQDEANARGVTHPQFVRGLDAGKEAAAELIERARNDHFTDPWTGTVPVGPGLWINNGPPAGPLFGTVTPYIMTSGSQFRPPPPPEFGSPAFLAALNEIRVLSDTRTPQQLAIAQFWAFGNGTFTPLGYWNLVASTYIAQYRLNERAAAHVFALMHASMLDAQIGCWDAKYAYWFLRPSQADPAITLPLGLPNHPSYPSGHSCNSSAATTILSHFFPAHATELEDQLAEAGVSRMYAGIHYVFDISAAVQIGTSVARLALAIDRSSGLLSVIP